MHRIWISLLTIISWPITQGAVFEFLLDDDEIFSTCPDVPGTNGVSDAVDLSEVTMEYHEGSIWIEGNMTIKWEGVQPTDRIETITEAWKFQRGTWQPTILSLRLFDFCAVQYDVHSKWYQWWSSNIPENERVCVNHYGHTYHYRPFKVNTVAEYNFNMEGRHKDVVRAFAYDAFNVRRPQIICFEIKGEYIKIK